MPSQPEATSRPASRVHGSPALDDVSRRTRPPSPSLGGTPPNRRDESLTGGRSVVFESEMTHSLSSGRRGLSIPVAFWRNGRGKIGDGAKLLGTASTTGSLTRREPARPRRAGPPTSDRCAVSVRALGHRRGGSRCSLAGSEESIRGPAPSPRCKPPSARGQVEPRRPPTHGQDQPDSEVKVGIREVRMSHRWETIHGSVAAGKLRGDSWTLRPSPWPWC